MKDYGGPWDVFRMVDSTRIGAPDAQQRIVLNIQDRYHHVHVTLEPSSASTSPFASSSWRQFSCGS
jgi:type VI protein secretion system component VasK